MSWRRYGRSLFISVTYVIQLSSCFLASPFFLSSPPSLATFNLSSGETMHHYSSKKRKISNIKEEEEEVYEECQDRISNLPDDILLRTLSFTHVKLAARTSVLSMRWRSLWTWHSSLDFSYWKSTQVDQCLNLHRAPKVRTFNIEKPVQNFYHDDSPNRLIASHRWVRFAATRKVEELSLVLPDEPFPSSLFECQTLSHLILKQGVFYFNGEFGGFKSLVTLCLEDVRIDKDVLNMMISECDLLENLKVADCRFGVMLLPKICAKNSPRLRNLEIIFDGTELRGIEVVAPGVLFISSRAGLRVPPWSYPRLSWEADAEGWRCRESSISCVKQKNLLIGDWLLRVQLGVSSFLYMRNMGRTFFCRFHISSSNK
ncbi:hypothetical protein AAC387_Pa06g2393 [Persea americana]